MGTVHEFVNLCNQSSVISQEVVGGLVGLWVVRKNREFRIEVRRPLPQDWSKVGSHQSRGG